MNIKEKTINEIANMKEIAFARFGWTLERWLDVAYKLDYITLLEKEMVIDAMLKTNSDDSYEKNYSAILEMRKILSNTYFPHANTIR